MMNGCMKNHCRAKKSGLKIPKKSPWKTTRMRTLKERKSVKKSVKNCRSHHLLTERMRNQGQQLLQLQQVPSRKF